MPLPAYFVCSEGISVDRDANKITLFSVSESMQIIPTELLAQLQQSAHQIIPPATLRIVSVWMREDSDIPETQYEHQFVFHFPKTEEIVLGQTPFTFTTARFHRLLSPPLFIPGFPGPGILKVEARIRKTGEPNWIGRQFFYIELSVVDVSSLLSPSPTAGKPPVDKS